MKLEKQINLRRAVVKKELAYLTGENQVKQNSSAESPEGAVKKDTPANSSQKSRAESGGSAIKELVEKYQGMVNPADKGVSY